MFIIVLAKLVNWGGDGKTKENYEEESHKLIVNKGENEVNTTMFTYSKNVKFSGFWFYNVDNSYVVNDKGEIVGNNSINFGLKKDSFVRRIDLNKGEINETQSEKNRKRMIYINKEILVDDVTIIYDENTLIIKESSNESSWEEKYYVEFVDLENKKIQLIIESDLSSIIYPYESGYNVVKDTTKETTEETTREIISVNFNIKKGDDIVYAYRSRKINNNEFIPNKTTLLGVHLTSNVTSIGSYAFQNCTGLSKITIPNNITTINECVFYGCTRLTKVEIPSNITSIGEGAFFNCSGLTWVKILYGVTTIGDSVFANCWGLIQIDIPNSVTTIGYNAFNSCIKLERVIIPSSVTFIGEGAFCNCRELTHIEIPYNIETINDFTFYGCNKLIQVIIKRTLTFVGVNVFTNGSKKTMIIYCDEDTETLIARVIDYTYNKIEFKRLTDLK